MDSILKASERAQVVKSPKDGASWHNCRCVKHPERLDRCNPAYVDDYSKYTESTSSLLKVGKFGL